MGAGRAKGRASADDGERFRAFVAIDLEPMSLRRVARVADRLRMGSGAPSASWTAPAKMHVTMKFLGDDFPLDAVAALGQALAPLADGQAPPPACPFRLDAFPSSEHARVIVVELDDAAGVWAKLAGQVDRLAAKHGVAREKRPFRPHVTIARLKRPYDARRWLRPELTEGVGDCKAASLTLYRSQLGGAEGSVYVPLAQFAFSG